MNSKKQVQKFAERLKKVRETHNLSRSMLASLVGAAQQRVCKWECSTNFPELDTFLNICELLNVCPYYLSGKSDNYNTWSPSEHAVTLQYDDEVHRRAYDAHNYLTYRYYGRCLRPRKTPTDATNSQTGDG